MFHTSTTTRRWLGVLGTFIVLGAAIAGIDWTPTETLFEQTQLLLRRDQREEAERSALRLTRCSTRSRESWMLAADSAARQQRVADPATYLAQVPDDGSPHSRARWLVEGRLEQQGFHRLSRAEQAFRNVLRNDAGNLDAHLSLASILSLQGRHWEATPHRMALVRNGQADLTTLVLLMLSKWIHP